MGSRAGRRRRSARCFEDRILSPVLLPYSWYWKHVAVMLGSALLGQKRYDEAEPLLLKGYEGMKQREKSIPKSGGGEKRIPEALNALFELYTATSKPEEVKKWQAERAKYPEGKPTKKK